MLHRGSSKLLQLSDEQADVENVRNTQKMSVEAVLRSVFMPWKREKAVQQFVEALIETGTTLGRNPVAAGIQAHILWNQEEFEDLSYPAIHSI